MKHFSVQFSLVAVLLAAVAVPVVGPQLVADGNPVPWGKRPGGVVETETLKLMANGWPVPWPKSPGFVLS
jgi:hypothetical protein